MRCCCSASQARALTRYPGATAPAQSDGSLQDDAGRCRAQARRTRAQMRDLPKSVRASVSHRSRPHDRRRSRYPLPLVQREATGRRRCDLPRRSRRISGAPAMTAYYNEIDPYAAQWLRNLIAAGHIAPGEVDERSIVDVQATDLVGFTQCHFFAGIGGWSLAFRMAGWSDDRPAWSGSCPCQPYSVGSVAHGGAQGQGDERHLWPAFGALIVERSPPIVVGEQVADAISWGWLDEVFWDLEAAGYACAAALLRAHSVGAKHRRKRLYWMADASGEGRPGHQPIERLPVPARTPLAEYGDTLARARAALAGDYDDLLRSDGVSVAVERHATKGYGNAIVPQVAAEFIGAFMDLRP